MPRKKPRSSPFASKVALGLALMLGTVPSFAATAGTITHLAGTLTAKRADGSIKLLSVNSEVAEGDELTTQQETYARIKFIDGGEIVLRPSTQLKVATYTYVENKPQSDSIVLNLLRGGLRAVTGLVGKRNREQFQLQTNTATIGIRGTHLGALFCSNDCGGVPTPTGKTPDNGLHIDVAAGAIVVTPKLTVALPNSGASSPNLPGTLTPTGSTPKPGGATAPSTPGTGTGSSPKPTAGPVGSVSPTLPGGSGSGTPTPTPAPTPGAGAPAPAVVLNAGQFGYLPPPQNGVQPPLVLVPPSQAVQVRMPMSISQNSSNGSGIGKNSAPECVVQ